MAVAGSPAPKGPKLDTRQFLPLWKSEFLWVTYSDVDCMCCKFCIDAGKRNVFTRGCSKFKKDVLTKHAHMVDHQAAVEAKVGRSNMQQALAHVHKIRSWQLLQP